MAARKPLHEFLEHVPASAAAPRAGRRPYLHSVPELSLLEESRREFADRIQNLFLKDSMGATQLLAQKEDRYRATMPAPIAEEIMKADEKYDVTLRAAVDTENKLYELEKANILDPQGTGAMNKLAFLDRVDEYQNRELRRGVRENRENDAGPDGFAFIMLDGDHFKGVNDKYGHPAGDAVLNELVRRIKNCVRETEGDVVCRYGGEEFIVLVKKGHIADKVAERIRRAIADEPFDVGEGKAIKFTASLGVTFHNFDTEKMIKNADEALYESKHSGRNRVTIYGQENKGQERAA